MNNSHTTEQMAVANIKQSLKKTNMNVYSIIPFVQTSVSETRYWTGRREFE